jgi:hypothetical protein
MRSTQGRERGKGCKGEEVAGFPRNEQFYQTNPSGRRWAKRDSIMGGTPVMKNTKRTHSGLPSLSNLPFERADNRRFTKRSQFAKRTHQETGNEEPRMTQIKKLRNEAKRSARLFKVPSSTFKVIRATDGVDSHGFRILNPCFICFIRGYIKIYETNPLGAFVCCCSVFRPSSERNGGTKVEMRPS